MYFLKSSNNLINAQSGCNLLLWAVLPSSYRNCETVQHVRCRYDVPGYNIESRSSHAHDFVADPVLQSTELLASSLAQIMKLKNSIF